VGSTVESGRTHVRLWRICIACWVPKATTDIQNIYYVILIYFPLQQCLHERSQSYIILAFAVLVLVTINQNQKEVPRHSGTITYLSVCWN
jgi:hypothetical protein